jgi:L-alanine-DL-glutamate epimerase-like enolase superfamily enzyme
LPYPVSISRVELYLFRAAIREPIRASFGIIPARTALLVRVEDHDGAFGWGEVWCNFPPRGMESKALLLESIIVPTALGRRWSSPTEAWLDLTSRLRRNTLQSAEPGPFAACLAGLDVAMWDMAGRKAGEPLWKLLGARNNPGPLRAYASNLNPDGAPEYVDACRGRGYTAFKMKVGFGLEKDLGNVARICRDLEPGERFMVDANQGWDLADARKAIVALNDYPLTWVEEALCADDPASHWAEVAMLSRNPLAGGENVLGLDAFDAVIAHGHLGVIQPDICKWGGLSGCLAVARRAVAAGRMYCPHWLNSGIGLQAAAHLLGAAGGPGMLEHDAMENPLQAVLAQPFPALADGCYPVTDSPGLGVEPDLAGAKGFLEQHLDLHA